jgi:mono/diheme cytochrome c family protein
MWRTIILLSLLSGHAVFADAILTVKGKGVTRTLSVSDFKKMKSNHELTLHEDSHGKKAHLVYQVVKVKDVLAKIDIPEGSSLLFTATDGFSGSIETSRLLDEAKNHSHAFIAYTLPKEEEKLGPFYLIWENPKASHISTEEWPYHLASLEVKNAADVSYPKIQPDASIKANDPIRKGLQIFQKNCFVCHTLNREGTSQVGPDLNVPFNPTEYLKDGFFERYVRNPQDLRHFPNDKMNGFSKEAISDEELGALKAYLTHMAKRKIDR